MNSLKSFQIECLEVKNRGESNENKRARCISI